jgi:hypothetical protein
MHFVHSIVCEVAMLGVGFHSYLRAMSSTSLLYGRRSEHAGKGGFDSRETQTKLFAGRAIDVCAVHRVSCKLQ